MGGIEIQTRIEENEAQKHHFEQDFLIPPRIEIPPEIEQRYLELSENIRDEILKREIDRALKALEEKIQSTNQATSLNLSLVFNG